RRWTRSGRAVANGLQHLSEGDRTDAALLGREALSEHRLLERARPRRPLCCVRTAGALRQGIAHVFPPHALMGVRFLESAKTPRACGSRAVPPRAALDRSTSAARMESRGTARSKKWMVACIDQRRETAIGIKL